MFQSLKTVHLVTSVEDLTSVFELSFWLKVLCRPCFSSLFFVCLWAMVLTDSPQTDPKIMSSHVVCWRLCKCEGKIYQNGDSAFPVQSPGVISFLPRSRPHLIASEWVRVSHGFHFWIYACYGLFLKLVFWRCRQVLFTYQSCKCTNMNFFFGFPLEPMWFWRSNIL